MTDCPAITLGWTWPLANLYRQFYSMASFERCSLASSIMFFSLDTSIVLNILGIIVYLGTLDNWYKH
jgi:hypothetical protein